MCEVTRKPKAESRKPKAESRKPKAESRKLSFSLHQFGTLGEQGRQLKR